MGDPSLDGLTLYFTFSFLGGGGGSGHTWCFLGLNLALSSGITLDVLGEPYGVPKIESRLFMCKVSNLVTVLLTWPSFLAFQGTWIKVRGC